MQSLFFDPFGWIPAKEYVLITTKMKHLFLLLFLFVNVNLQAQTKFKIVESDGEDALITYTFVDENDQTLKILDSQKYYTAFYDLDYGHFAVVGIKGSPGWFAIDVHENVLFRVYNTSFGEPSPDYLIENKIRIIDNNEKIGFANEKGKIIIKPQFELASSFHNGYAIIAENCNKTPWPGHENCDCHHYSMECKKHGYIDEKGNIIKFGDYTVDQIIDEIGWQPDQQY